MANVNTFAVDPEIFQSILPAIRQYEATSGRTISNQALRQMLEAKYNVAAQRSAEAKQQDLQQQALDIRKEQIAKESKAATVGGAIQLGGTAITLGLLGKGGYFGTNIQNALGGATTPATGLVPGALPTTVPTFAPAPPLSAGPLYTPGATAIGDTGGGVPIAAGSTAIVNPPAAVASGATAADTAAFSATGALTGAGIGLGAGFLLSKLFPKSKFIHNFGGPLGGIVGGLFGGLSAFL